MPERSTGRVPSLVGRLALAFVVVGLAAVIIVVAVVSVTSDRESNAVRRTDRDATSSAVTAALARAHAAADGDWADADLTVAFRLAADGRAALIVRDVGESVVRVSNPRGQEVTAGTRSGALPAPGGETTTAPVQVDGRSVGSAELRFPGAGALTSSEERLRDALVRNAILASLGVALVALLAAAFVASRLRAPLARMAGAARALEAGDRTARVGPDGAPGELGEVAGALDSLADTLQRQQEARSVMVSDLAHELRTPLTILRGSLEELLDIETAPEPEEIASLHEEVLRLERLTDDLATLADSDPAVLRLTPEPVDLAEIARDVVTALGARARAAGVAVEVQGDHAALRGDRDRLAQVVRNLVGNALKFTPEGGTVTVEVRAHPDAVGLVVADTGPGIPADELPHVFDRFWRGRAARGIGGTGVGLAVVQRIVEAHGGTVTADGPAGGGARFTVRLPVR